MARDVLFVLAGLGLAFLAGWTGAEWKRDSVELVAERAAGLAADRARDQLQGVPVSQPGSLKINWRN